MYFDHSRYNAYLHGLLEPSDILITGKHKRDTPVLEVTIPTDRHFDNLEYLKLTAKEKAQIDDKYLKTKGI